VTAEEVKGLTCANSAGIRIGVQPDRVWSYEVRRDGVVVVKFSWRFTRNRHDAWDGYVSRFMWAARRPGSDHWSVDDTRRDAVAGMEGWCEEHRRPRHMCKCEAMI